MQEISLKARNVSSMKRDFTPETNVTSVFLSDTTLSPSGVLMVSITGDYFSGSIWTSESYEIFLMGEYFALSMKHLTYPVQNQNGSQCWCSIRGKSASRSSDGGDPDTYKWIIKHYSIQIVVEVPLLPKSQFLFLKYQMLRINYS